MIASSPKTVTDPGQRIRPLRSTDLIAIVSPASWLELGLLDRARSRLEEAGFAVQVSKQSFKHFGSFAGDDNSRAEALNEAFADNDVAAILCARGGYGTSRILSLLDFDIIRRNPKILIGYSDATCLINTISQRCGFPTFHGPMAVDLGSPDTLLGIDEFLDFFAGRTDNICSYTPAHDSVLRSGSLTTSAYGGNLTLLEGMLGTPYMPRLDGCLLLVEDVNEQLYRIDRAFNHLHLAGAIRNIAGACVGDISDTDDRAIVELGKSDIELCREYLCSATAGPVILHAPFCHSTRKRIMPLGCPVSLSVSPSEVAIRLAAKIFF